MMADRRRGHPFEEFVKPGRRRTDHPLVVGTIVLCLGILTVTALLLLMAQWTLGQHIKAAIAKNDARDVETQALRLAFRQNMQAQASLLRRVCFNVARTEADQRECEADRKGGPPN